MVINNAVPRIEPSGNPAENKKRHGGFNKNREFFFVGKI